MNWIAKIWFEMVSGLSPDLAAFAGTSLDYRPLFRAAFGSPDITRERVAMAIASYERTLVSDQAPFDRGTMTAQQRSPVSGSGRPITATSATAEF